jgi:hypothetical protein
LERIWFFGVKSCFFTRNIPKFFAPPSGRRNFFKCAPLTWNPGSAPVFLYGFFFYLSPWTSDQQISLVPDNRTNVIVEACKGGHLFNPRSLKFESCLFFKFLLIYSKPCLVQLPRPYSFKKILWPPLDYLLWRRSGRFCQEFARVENSLDPKWK